VTSSAPHGVGAHDRGELHVHELDDQRPGKSRAR
jgi:hypothetical protein